MYLGKLHASQPMVFDVHTVCEDNVPYMLLQRILVSGKIAGRPAHGRYINQVDGLGVSHTQAAYIKNCFK